jgi:DNA-binding MarR family transcriptional regulator
MPANKLSENEELTTSEKHVLRAYRDHVEQYGAAPTLRHLGSLIGVGHNTIYCALQRLEKKGYMQKQKITAVRLRLSAKGKKVEL